MDVNERTASSLPFPRSLSLGLGFEGVDSFPNFHPPLLPPFLLLPSLKMANLGGTHTPSFTGHLRERTTERMLTS